MTLDLQHRAWDYPLPVGDLYDRERIIESAIAYWREEGFPYRNLPLHECMDALNRLAVADPKVLFGTDLGYWVADTYHPERFHATARGMRSPVEAFGDDTALRRAIGLLLEYGQSLTPANLLHQLATVSHTQACANFRPGVAVAIYRAFGGPGAVVLDTCSGYGGRLVGWMASALGGRYVGIDPSLAACLGNLEMADDLGFEDSVEQINAPAEEVDLPAGTFDLAFTSPPYFTKERYAAGDPDEDRQSWYRYPEPDAWRRGFLEPLLRLQHRALRPGAMAVLNVQDVKHRATVYPLTEWTAEAALAAGFETQDYGDMTLRLQRRFGAGHPDVPATEPILVFRKPIASEEAPREALAVDP